MVPNSLGIVLFAVIHLLPWMVDAIPREQFYSFGPTAGDLALPPNDDGSSNPLILQGGFFPFFGQDHTTLYVNNNGDISFDGPVGTFTPQTFPLSGSSLIAPYWADVDTRGTGTVFYRETRDTDLIRRARDDVLRAFSVRFQPSFLFIATWDRVGHFSSNTERIATFQCVLMTDGTFSFVAFLYADGEIQWTTGDASDGENGFGGTPAQVGFDAGDGERFFSVPGSQTADIVNIPTTTNVGIPGVWMFQVNGDVAACTEDTEVPVATVPRIGNMLGGTAIALRGPCFLSTDSIECSFEGVEEMVTGVFVDESMALCVSPEFDRRGWKNLQVTIRSSDDIIRYQKSTTFYAVYFEDNNDVQHNLEDLFVHPQNSLTVTWSPESLVPMMESNTFLVNIGLAQFNPNTTRWEDVEMLVEGVENTGSRQIDIPLVLLKDGPLVEVRPLAVQVRLGQSLEPVEVRRKRNIVALGALIWSAVIYYSISDSLRQRCEDWCDSQPDNIGDLILAELPPCPPRLEQALSSNSGLVQDSGVSRFLSNNFFHRGTDTCFRTREPSSSGYGQQCCYSGDALVVGPPGGSVDKVAPVGTLESYAGHFNEDVLPLLYCCVGAFSNCEMYHRKRPSDNGARFSPPVPACAYGDPHIVTLDGLKYTFNGQGEYILVQVGGDTFSLQGRMVRATNPQGDSVDATVFSAIVMKEGNSEIIQFQTGSIPGDPEALANGTFISFIDVQIQELNGVSVKKENNTLSARFDSGAYIEVREQNGFLSTLLVSLPVSWRGLTIGLMGNYNNDTSDDLAPRVGSPIPTSSELRDIHNMFGITWIISDAEDSLFTYAEGESWPTYFFPDFEPTYEITFSDPALEQAANEMCGDDLFCRFDIATTENTEVGLSTLIGSQELEEIVEISQPVVCDPPCQNGACITTDNCSCSVGYIGDRCDTAVVTPCDNSPCENGGTCEIRAGSYVCMCPPAFAGANCQTVIDNCSLPMELGDCNDTISRYYFNRESGVCEPFIYSGCGGNPNNFESIRDCLQYCNPRECPPYCSVDYCSDRTTRTALCTIQNPLDTECSTVPCRVTYCHTCYYDDEYRPLPSTCKTCTTHVEIDHRFQGRCLRRWATCTRRADGALYQKPPQRDRTPNRFKCYEHPCV